MEVYFDNRQELINITNNIKEDIIKCIKIALEIENIYSNNLEVSVSFVDNEEIKKLNNKYRNINSQTDVLSFPTDDYIGMFDSDIPVLLGDIIISTEKAIEQAIEFEHSIHREIIYLTCHSIFHLLGYDHINYEDKLIMREKEKTTMRKLKIYKNEK